MVGPGEDGSSTSTPSPPRLESREPQLAAVDRGLLGDDREPEAGAAGRRALAAGERLEQPRALVGRDAGAVVLDPDDQPPVDAARARRRRCRPAPAVQRGVVEQVVDEQPQAALPAVDRALVDAAGELVVDARVALARAVHGGVEQVAELDGLARQALGRLAAGERLQALEQMDHAVLLGGHVGHAAPRAGRAAVRGCGRACRAGRAARSAACAARGRRRRRSAGSPRARAPWRRSASRAATASRSARRRAERTSSGAPRSSASGVERSSAPLTRAAPPRSRASGRTASVVKPHAASAVSASAIAPSSSTSRRVRLTRSSTGASELSDLQPRVADRRDVERERAPRRAGDVDRLEAVGCSGTASGWSGTSPAWLDDVVAVGDLRERAAAAQQRLAPIAAAAVRVAGRGAGSSRRVRAGRRRPGCGRRARRRRAAARPASSPQMPTAATAASTIRARRLRGQPHGRSAQPTPRTVWRMRGSPPTSSLRRR